MFGESKKSGLSKATAAVVIVIVIAAARVAIVFATTNTRTTTVTQTVTQSATLTTTETSLPAPTENNTIDLTASRTLTLAVVGAFGDPVTGNGSFIIGTLHNPTIKVKVGTHMEIVFHSSTAGRVYVYHSFVITNSKPRFSFPLNQSDVTPAFPGASTDNPLSPQKDQFTLDFTADQLGTYYICGFFGHVHFGMYGQFIVEG